MSVKIAGSSKFLAPNMIETVSFGFLGVPFGADTPLAERFEKQIAESHPHNLKEGLRYHPQSFFFLPRFLLL